jgi:hypothetical protein
MKKLILNIILCMFLISFISAINLQAGEKYILELSESYSYYEITENSSKMDINVTKNGTNVLIETSKYLEDCSFKITFYNEKNEVIGSSGGGGGSRNSGDYWTCGDWSRCLNGTQTRICYDSDNILEEKTETRNCIPEYTPLSSKNTKSDEGNNDEDRENKSIIQNTENFFTGAVTGITEFVKTPKGISLSIFFLMLIAVFIIVKVFRR